MADRGSNPDLSAPAPAPPDEAPAGPGPEGAVASSPAAEPAAAADAAPPRSPWWRRVVDEVRAWPGAAVASVRDQDPTFWNAFTPALVVAALCFVRSPSSNYIFDEQEALLANPYVNGVDLAFWDVWKRDFWGLPPERSIGSYRPIPNLIWRTLWGASQAPWLHHWVNVLGHAVNASLLASFTLAVSGLRRLSWLVGAAFLLSAVLTEAVTGVVGIADVLGGMGVLLGLNALRAPLLLAPAGVALGVAFGLGSKESALVAVPLLAWAALVLSPALHPERPRPWLRALLTAVAAAGAFWAYVEFRRHYFPVKLPEALAEPLPESAPWPARAVHGFQRWFAQPRLPSDPVNNPLIQADFPHRVAGALRVYWRGLTQVVLPLRLAGDYSSPAEPIPTRLFFPESILGGLALVLPPLAGVGLWVRDLFLGRRGAPPEARLAGWLLAVGLVWFPVAFFPHSNIPVLLPTVRAERFWYLPVLGTALCLGLCFDRLWSVRRGAAMVVLYLGLQGARTRAQALLYTDDLTFWRFTRIMSPESAKAHLNYGVMKGARGDLEERRIAGARTLELAPRWPMANIYQGDTLCRLHRVEEAWAHYKRGFELGPNEQSLISLALQCLWDEKVQTAEGEERAVFLHEQELLDLAEAHPGSWIAYLAKDILLNGEKHNGVDPNYRPRNYNEGPKKDK